MEWIPFIALIAMLVLLAIWWPEPGAHRPESWKHTTSELAAKMGQTDEY